MCACEATSGFVTVGAEVVVSAMIWCGWNRSPERAFEMEESVEGAEDGRERGYLVRRSMGE